MSDITCGQLKSEVVAFFNKAKPESRFYHADVEARKQHILRFFGVLGIAKTTELLPQHRPAFLEHLARYIP